MNDEQSLDALIKQGEGPTLEFKSAVPAPPHLARTLAAFANSSGGTLLLGVRDDGSIPGVYFVEARNGLETALKMLKPQPEALSTELRAGSKSVMRIDVKKEPAAPVIAPDGIYKRSGTLIEALPAEEIRQMAQSAPSLETVIDPLAKAVQALTEKVLELEKQVIAAQGWKRRAPDMLIGALISALLGVILTMALVERPNQAAAGDGQKQAAPERPGR